jgi:hypothetical protein
MVLLLLHHHHLSSSPLLSSPLSFLFLSPIPFSHIALSLPVSFFPFLLLTRSRNGKSILYSGDASGLVFKHDGKKKSLLESFDAARYNCESRVVQLSSYPDGRLLVSCLTGCIVLAKADPPVKIGTQPRDSKHGGCFFTLQQSFSGSSSASSSFSSTTSQQSGRQMAASFPVLYFVISLRPPPLVSSCDNHLIP